MGNSFQNPPEIVEVNRKKAIFSGLDTLRFVTAMWVAFSHGARFPIDRLVQPDTLFHKLLYMLCKTTFNGTAAVAVFFLISGFLIHGASLRRQQIDPLPFLTRRGVRICLPLVVVLVAAWLLGPDYQESLSHVTWSVYAEIIYYALYPLVFPLIIRFGIGRVLLVSQVISLAMIATHPGNIYLWSFGWPLTWLFCAPLWLMGCYLAEHIDSITKTSAAVPVWAYRVGAVAFCYLTTVLSAHAGRISIGYTWTIWGFGVFCMFWLAAEMARGTGARPIAWLERFGLAGYSLYLTHKFVITLVSPLLATNPIAFWVLVNLGILVAGWAFYKAVEAPSHHLARALGKRLENRGKAAAISA